MRYVFALFLILLVPLNAPAGNDHGAFTKHYKNSLFNVSGSGHYSVELVIKEHDLRVGANKLDVIVHNRKNQDVAGAKVDVVPWMPAMGHGVSEQAVVAEQGGGLYRAENVVLSMGGRWELKVKVKKGAVEDTTVFVFPAVATGRNHAHSAHQAVNVKKNDFDTSSVRETAHFHVEYSSAVTPIPINKLHSWELKIVTPQGKPVTGARVTIEGDMPGHGHGLPTAPEVTREIRDGLYLVEGLRFSMPGRWIMKFHIQADGKQDTVAFNLVPQ